LADADSNLTLAILKDIRADLRNQQTLLLQLSEAQRRHTQRFADLKRRLTEIMPELELMLKSEVMGRLTQFETRIDDRIEELTARFSDKSPPAA
jgi:predicted nuclease with TOPRIM domain